MKVLHIAAGNLFGGVETYLATLARLRHLCAEMEPQFGLCFPGRLRDKLKTTGVPIHDLGAVRVSRPWRVLGARRRLRRLVRERGIDIVATHGCWAHAVFGPAIPQRCPRLVHFVHDSMASRHWLNRWAARTPPDAVIANSRFTESTVHCLFTETPVDVCFLPVAEPHIGDRVTVRREVRAALNTAPDAVVILLASRLERWKGHTVLLAALAQLRDESNWMTWIAGGPQKTGEAEYLSELQSLAQARGIVDRVRFLGQRSDVSQLMAAADIYCQPNTVAEPFGVVFVEALYAGLPVVTAGLGGALEIVTDECGVLCPPGEAGAVANTLGALLADPERRQLLGLKGPKRAAALCDPARQMAALARALERESRS